MALSYSAAQKVSSLSYSWRYLLTACFILLLFSTFYSPKARAAQLTVLQQKNEVFFIVSAQKGDVIQIEKADFDFIYGLDLELYQGDTVYRLSSLDSDFNFPERMTLSEGMLVGRSITKKQLSEFFAIKQGGRYRLVATFCLSDGRCLNKAESSLQFSQADL